MLKNILGKPKADPNKDAELAKLREKFNTIVKKEGPAAAPSASVPMQPAANIPNLPQQQFKFVDPERAEENERITNLIMQQIKELIEIDNNLNTKIKELESTVDGNNSTLAQTKTIVEQFNTRLELIEKNMEKFMGLYEVVTNRFNPFVSEEEVETPSATVVEDVISRPAVSEEQVTNRVISRPVVNNEQLIRAKAPMDEEQLITREIDEIMQGTSLQLDMPQKTVVQDELRKAIGMVGPQSMDDVKQELAQHISQTIGQQVQQAMAKHIKVSNDEIKNTMKDLLMETIIHLRQANKEPVTPQQTAAQPASPASQTWVDKEVHPDYHFLLPDGTHVRSLRGLIEALKTMDETTFKSHVNAEKNDFAEWIRVVMKKSKLADAIAKLHTRQGIQKALATVA
jgi:archaellum component FlaC